MTNKAQRYIPDILEDILKELKKIKVMVPPIDYQNKFVIFPDLAT